MKQKILFFLFTLLLPYTLHAQKEANNWFFGYGCGITWNTTQDAQVQGVFGTPNATLSGLPTNITPPATIPISTFEGSFALSDGNGQLLFYSDGTKIWNKNHQEMSNGSGLTGHWSSTQSGIVIPYPEHENQYMAITIAAQENSNTASLAYSIIDMTLDSGLGGVVPTQKNKLFTGGMGKLMEAVTSVMHANGKDYWVLAPGVLEYAAVPLNIWLVTKDGMSSTPNIIPLLGMLPGGNNVGHMKISPNGKYFVRSANFERQILLGKFDDATGTLSDMQIISTAEQFYGVEFSASGEYLYVSASYDHLLRVYKTADLLAGTSTFLQYSIPVELGNTYAASAGALQLGPDGRMYMAVDGGTFLYVIDNPEDYGNLRIYKTPSLGSGRKSGAGLPTFSASWWNLNIDDIETDPVLPACKGTEITFTATLSSTDLSQIASIKWNFGNGIVIDDTNIGTSISQNHTYAKAGQYTLTLTPYDINGDPLTAMEKTQPVKISGCVMPVNPNIHILH